MFVVTLLSRSMMGKSTKLLVRKDSPKAMMIALPRVLGDADTAFAWMRKHERQKKRERWEERGRRKTDRWSDRQAHTDNQTQTHTQIHTYAHRKQGEGGKETELYFHRQIIKDNRKRLHTLSVWVRTSFIDVAML